MQKKKFLYILLSLILIIQIKIFAQVKDYRIHNRGMLHETVYNTGEIGRPWNTGESGNKTSVPLMEWPSNSATIVNGIEYSGQHNLIGAGVYIGANIDTIPGEVNRLFALCGGVGTGSGPEKVYNRWSFPISIEKKENYPILEDGSLNENYDPNEAEEIITAKWATPIGITVTRTSRAWSHPDYDDFIIYEYEFEYTGDTTGNGITDRTAELHDVMFCFNYGMAPSMYGFQRLYQEWKYEGGIYRGDLRGYFDAELWLKYNMNLYNYKTEPVMAKPEPDPELFWEFAETGKNGGGLCSPQAPGWCMLNYDTSHLAYVVPDSFKEVAAKRGIFNESEAAQDARREKTTILAENYDPYYHKIARKNSQPGPQGQYNYTWYFELDENYHIKQPWCNKVSTGNTRSDKMKHQKDPFNPTNRWSGTYKPESNTWPDTPPYGGNENSAPFQIEEPNWNGRAAFNYRQAADAGMQLMTFGPYTVKHGDKLEFALAEVVGYGADSAKIVEGGRARSLGKKQWTVSPSWNRKYTKDGDTLTTAYLDEYGYPDYVNSDVITVQDVAKKAMEAYLGYEPELPVWPQNFPKDGNYQIEQLPPAPAITVENTDQADILLTWKRAQEDFAYLNTELKQYYIYRSTAGMGPWHLLDSVYVGESQYLNENGIYEFFDTDTSFKVGDKRFYAVTSVGENGKESGKTNITQWRKDVRSVPEDEWEDVHVVPNPFIEQSGFKGQNAESIGFYGLPEECTIRIYSYAGQLVDKIKHNEPVFSKNKNLATINHQDMASGIYFYVVTTPSGKKVSGKFIILK